ncbi:MAG TPA: SoxR reducing system RseC family protein [Bacteroidales bacterium]|jgi:sigma-E factor negative regulatory protein RseC|nr:SoxR reducing system RseC family protein [Bacteroidales bacterium]HPE40041.1 SoxR reducing system RseC family protein [Bacteroidales bacterium]
MSQNPNQVCTQAVVREVHDTYIVAEIVIQSACAACHAKDACGVSDRREEKIKVPISNPQIYSIGEVVSLEMKQGLGMKAVVIAYLLPFFVLILGLLVTYKISKNELLSIGVSLGLTALYYLSIYKLKDKFEKEFVFTIRKQEQ